MLAFFSRDLDGDISERELAAVLEFLDSDKQLHTMRDHPEHGTVILGGTWGIKLQNPEIRQKMKETFNNMMNDEYYTAPRTAYGADQKLIANHIW